MSLTAPASTKGRLVVLISGSGSTLQNILDAIDRREVAAQVVLVVSSRASAKGLQIASGRGIDTAVVPSARFKDKSSKQTDWKAFSAALTDVVLPAAPHLVIFGGFLCLYELPSQLEGRCINIHPALIPAFSGRGMYGAAVHQAVVQRGCKITGCTVHFVTNEYDAGPIILQRVCSVTAQDDVESVQAKVNAEERIAYPEAVQMFVDGRLSIRDGVVHIAPAVKTKPSWWLE